MTQGRAYPAATRAAVLAAILSGASVSDVARAHGVDKGTVSRWAAANTTLATMRNRERDPETIAAAVYDLIVDHVRTMRAQLDFVTSTDYLKEQPAAAIAELFEVEGNVLLRLLAGLRPVEVPEE